MVLEPLLSPLMREAHAEMSMIKIREHSAARDMPLVTTPLFYAIHIIDVDYVFAAAETADDAAAVICFTRLSSPLLRHPRLMLLPPA